MNGSSISHDWANVRDKKNNKKKLNNRTGIFCALHTAPQWNLLFSSLLFYLRKKENPSDSDR